MDRNAQRMVGKVVSSAMDKTVVVSVERLVKHKLYKKYMKRSKIYYAHDEKNKTEIDYLFKKPHKMLCRS